MQYQEVEQELGQVWLDCWFDRVHIRYLGNGRLGFRSYSDSLFQTPECRPSKK